MSTVPVKWFMSTMQGAPRLSGTAGDMIGLLDACLINGFNVTAPNSLSVADGVASLYYSGGGHGYVQHQVILVDGAAPATLNGEWRVTEVDANYVRFAAPGEPDGTASGTIGVRTAPVGQWEKAFSGTNKAVYRSTDIAGTRLFLRIDDTGTLSARARGYEAMTDVDTGTGPFPTLAQVADPGAQWMKSYQANTTAREYALIGDSRIIYLMSLWYTSYAGRPDGFVFGDIFSWLPGDSYGCVLVAHENAGTISYPGQYVNFAYGIISNTMGRFMARPYTHVAGAIKFSTPCSGVTSFFGSEGEVYPSAADGGLHLHEPMLISEGTTVSAVKRGHMPGVLQPIQNKPLSHGDVIQYGGELIIILHISTTTNEGRVAFRISGSWR